MTWTRREELWSRAEDRAASEAMFTTILDRNLSMGEYFAEVARGYHLARTESEHGWADNTRESAAVEA